MQKHYLLHALILLFLSILPSLSGAANLPQKAFNVEGGMVSVRAGVMPNPEAPAGLPIGKLKYPTRYFVELGNESPYPIWLDAAWTFPDANQDKQAKSKTIRSKKVPARGSYWFYSDKLGVVVDQPIAIELQAYADEKRANRVGGQTAELVFDQQSVDHFLANFPNPFKGQAKQTVVISGWRDIPGPRTDVPGTLADAQLQRDIQLNIWKADSSRRWACEREVRSAAPMTVEDSQLLSKLSEDLKANARLEQANNQLSAERWLVRSCGQDLVYEVLLSRSPSGGTDVLVIDTTDGLGLPTPEPNEQ